MELSKHYTKKNCKCNPETDSQEETEDGDHKANQQARVLPNFRFVPLS